MSDMAYEVFEIATGNVVGRYDDEADAITHVEQGTNLDYDFALDHDVKDGAE